MLLIDIGNSRIKLGHYDGQSITELSPLAWRERDLAQVWTTLLGVLPPVPRVVVSNVGGAVVVERIANWYAETRGENTVGYELIDSFSEFMEGGGMALFAYMPTLPFVILGVALHGFCFGCFIFVAFMVVDENTTPDIRATAQNLFNLVIVGIGIIVGSLFATSVVAKYATAGGEMDYQKLFSVPMYMALGCLVLMLLFYPSKKKAA
jgi:MFS family permease